MLTSVASSSARAVYNIVLVTATGPATDKSSKRHDDFNQPSLLVTCLLPTCPVCVDSSSSRDMTWRALSGPFVPAKFSYLLTYLRTNVHIKQ